MIFTAEDGRERREKRRRKQKKKTFSLYPVPFNLNSVKRIILLLGRYLNAWYTNIFFKMPLCNMNNVNNVNNVNIDMHKKITYTKPGVAKKRIYG